MLDTLEGQELRAAASLLSNRDFEKILEWLEKQRIRLAVVGIESNEAVRWSGGFKVLDELLNNFKTSREVLEKIDARLRSKRQPGCQEFP